jgi:hypothetical protein
VGQHPHGGEAFKAADLEVVARLVYKGLEVVRPVGHVPRVPVLGEGERPLPRAVGFGEARLVYLEPGATVRRRIRESARLVGRG